MIRHDLHCQYCEGILFSELQEHSFDIIIQTVPQDRFPVLRALYDMVLERIDISSTICKIVIIDFINIFLHNNIIPYVSCNNKQKRYISFSSLWIRSKKNG
jgi:hypothetical protein